MTVSISITIILIHPVEIILLNKFSKKTLSACYITTPAVYSVIVKNNMSFTTKQRSFKILK